MQDVVSLFISTHVYDCVLMILFCGVTLWSHSVGSNVVLVFLFALEAIASGATRTSLFPINHRRRPI
ncbi:hypothetical protein BDV24DRAFT_37750 [Aspergillus arachidicola]|uniref:Uncharacterized protein n=1 Tax=Aspergillus arachidicola TaxID=656916 RepID=A0A5N6YC70_9EURO|nr:hypothetical protein BDV24DRAFT_37750 [Aspergillus arachidicola]